MDKRVFFQIKLSSLAGVFTDKFNFPGGIRIAKVYSWIRFVGIGVGFPSTKRLVHTLKYFEGDQSLPFFLGYAF